MIASKYLKPFFRNKGKQWEEKERRGNKYQEVELSSNEKAEFFFTQLITPPVSELACLDFRYKKFSTSILTASSNAVRLKSFQMVEYMY